MTFGEMKQAVYDLLGLTNPSNVASDTVTMVERFINQAKDEFVTSANWWFLESSADLPFTSGSNALAFGTDVSRVLEITKADGAPVRRVHRDDFEALFRNNTAVESAPRYFRIEGTETTAALKGRVWPTPNATSTGEVRYIKRVPDMTTTADVPYHIPPEHHQVLVKIAAARYREWEGHPSAQGAATDAERTIAKLRGQTLEDALTDGA